MTFARRRSARVAGLGACLLAALLLGPATPSRGAFPGANGKLAYSSARDGNIDVYSIDPDGSGETRLTSDPGVDSNPAWSADGRRIVFHSTRSGAVDIYVMNADGSGQTRLTDDPAADTTPSWSPDGTKIAFESARGATAGNGTDIYVMNADGSGVTRLTDQPNDDEHPVWSPDGTKIVFWNGRVTNVPAGVYVMNADGSGQTRIVDGVAPDWSPDGRQLTYYAGASGHTGVANDPSEVFRINADGSGMTKLTSAGASAGLPAWSPDGTRIAFQMISGGSKYEIHTMNVDGSGVTKLTESPTGSSAVAWQPNVTLPAPKQGETVNVSVVSGTVLVKTRGQAGFQLLSQARQIKVGSQLDTKKGVVRLASAAGKGKTQTGDFGRGVFQVAQSKASKAFTELQLKGGSFSSCSAAAKKGSAAAKKKTIRSLFSKAKGRFRTKGRYSAASVRGTSWLVTDRCDGTLTSVKSGTVDVFDFKRKRTVKVKPGRSYLARAR
jgi:TolB protein